MMVADTDVLIDFLAGKGPAAARVGLELEAGRLQTTVITCFELLCGARNSRQESIVRDLLEALPVLPLGEEEADRAAQVRRTLDRRGEAIGMADSLIAGVVLTRGATLLTRNRRHFDRVKGLQVVALE
jgi:tRNA(fMet)-specific endonuclease VapC